MTCTPIRRILVVDHHRVLTDLIAWALDAEPDLACVGVADDAPRALALAAVTRPDTVLLEVQLPSADGITVLARLRETTPELRVIVLTAHPRRDLERAALAAGAVGYLGKDGLLVDLLEAIRHASSTCPARDVRLASRSDRAADTWHLTPRELEVLGMLGDGLDVRAVSGRLGLSIHTTRGHVKAMLAKMDARSQLEAVATAGRAGVLRVGVR